MLALLGVVLVVAGLSFWLNARAASSQLNEQYEDRALVIAQTVADMPEVVQALSRTEPVSAVEPIALRVAHSTGADFIVVVDRKGIRLSYPNPARVGTWFGEAVASLDGRDHVRIRPSPVPSANAGVPVFAADRTVIGQVSVGYHEQQVSAACGGHCGLPAPLPVPRCCSACSSPSSWPVTSSASLRP